MAVRVGIVGAGGIARAHAARLASTEGAEVTAVHDVDQARAAELAQAHDARVAVTMDELLDDCEAVFVCTWTAAHRDSVERAAARGHAIFCEKPLAPTLADARAMADAVQAAGVVNQVGLALRWTPLFAVLRRLLTDPANGQVLAVSLNSESANRTGFLSGWRGDVALSGGGMLLEVGFHDLDLLEWLVGPVESIRAFTCERQRGGIDDGATVSLAFADGAVGTLVTALHDAPTRPQSRVLRIACEHAQYTVDVASSAQLSAACPGERQLSLGRDDLERMAAELGLSLDAHTGFVRAAESQRPATPDFAAALRVHTLIDAAYQSASRRETPVSEG